MALLGRAMINLSLNLIDNNATPQLGEQLSFPRLHGAVQRFLDQLTKPHLHVCFQALVGSRLEQFLNPALIQMRDRLFCTPPRNAYFFSQARHGLRRRFSEKAGTDTGLNDEGFGSFPRKTHGFCCGYHGFDDEEEMRRTRTIIIIRSFSIDKIEKEIDLPRYSRDNIEHRLFRQDGDNGGYLFQHFLNVGDARCGVT